MSRRSVAVASVVGLMFAATLGATPTEPPIIAAVKAGRPDAVRTLLEHGTDVNATEPDGTTALHWAARADDVDSVQRLLHAGAHVGAVNRYGITPLALAATNGSAAVIEILLKAGADPNTQLTEGETVLMRTARSGHADAVKVLLARGAKVNVAEQSLGETALMWAAAEDHPEVVQVLIAAGANLDATSKRETRPIRYVSQAGGGTRVPLPRGGWTAVMYAARQDSIASARVLAEAGADLNLTDPDGTCALIDAIINMHYDLAAMLLEEGADPNVVDSQGMSPLYAAVDMHTLPAMTDRPPRRTSDVIDSAKLTTILLDYGADPNARLKSTTLQRHFNVSNKTLGPGTTPFMRAANSGDVLLMRALLAGGADPLLTQKNRTTALMLAAGLAFRNRGDDDESNDGGSEQGALEAMKLCLDLGIDIDAFNDTGQTAMHAAVNRGDASIKFLAAHGAMLDLKDKRGRTPLDLALQTPSQTMPALLRELMKSAGTQRTSSRQQ
jgi:ankyrin repeat protein